MPRDLGSSLISTATNKPVTIASAVLGRWKHGFFSMVPVGATNVGSIVVNFDKVRFPSLPADPHLP